jgi:hypothetical protein
MRIVSVAVAAIFLAVSSYAVQAASPVSVQGLKSASGIQLIKSDKKSAKKSKKKGSGKAKKAA